MMPIRLLVILVLLLFSNGVPVSGNDNNLAPARLTDEQSLALVVDILAKAISQQRPHYMKMVLSKEVVVNDTVFVRKEAIAKILSIWGEAKVDFQRDAPKQNSNKNHPAPKSAGVQVVGGNQATATLKIIMVQGGENLTLTTAAITELTVEFVKHGVGWKITSLQW